MSPAEIHNIADHLKIKTKLVCSSCGAPGEGSCRCGVPYVTPGERAEAAVKANPGKSDRTIAEELGVSHTTVQRARKATGTNVPVEKRTGKDGKARKMPRHKTVTKEKMQEVLKVRRERGISQKEAGREAGFSEQGVKKAEAYYEGWEDCLDSLGVNPETMAMSAKAKLETAKRLMERKLNAEHAARMRGLEEEVRQRVLKEGKEYLTRMKEREEKAAKTIETYQEYTNNHKPLLSTDQFNLLRKCLHQGGIAASPKDFDAAFDLIQSKKFKLTGQK